MNPLPPEIADPEARLKRCRRDIEALDRRVLHLVCERLALAREIGELKQQQGLPVRNYEVESQVHKRFEEAGRFLGLDGELGRDLALFLIEKSVEEQASLLDTIYEGGSLSALVIGGKGGMGRWLARFLNSQGHQVTVFDPDPKPSPYRIEDDLEAAVSASDLILVSVPMGICGELMSRIASFRPRGVIAEICSFKSHLQPVLSQIRQQGLRAVSFHPLFGPGVRMLHGQTVVVCTDGQPEDREIVKALFDKTSARLVEMDPEEHDRRMSLVLGLTHLTNLMYARTLSTTGIDPKDLDEVAGVTFRKQLATCREVSAENPELYFEIQALNPQARETGEWLRDALDDWTTLVAGDDSEGFASLMRSCRRDLDGGQEGPG